MNWTALRLLYVHEMRMVLRSPRTIVIALVLPAILMPLMITGSRYIQESQSVHLEATTFKYAVVGSWANQAGAQQNRKSVGLTGWIQRGLPKLPWMLAPRPAFPEPRTVRA
jgi:hypothetical protein